MKLTKELLASMGWVEKNGVMVRYSHPRLGWKPDGTLIVGYWEHKEKIHTLEQLNKALYENRQSEEGHQDKALGAAGETQNLL